jgi:hypothetical protein
LHVPRGAATRNIVPFDAVIRHDMSITVPTRHADHGADVVPVQRTPQVSRDDVDVFRRCITGIPPVHQARSLLLNARGDRAATCRVVACTSAA